MMWLFFTLFNKWIDHFGFAIVWVLHLLDFCFGVVHVEPWFDLVVVFGAERGKDQGIFTRIQRGIDILILCFFVLIIRLGFYDGNRVLLDLFLLN